MGRPNKFDASFMAKVAELERKRPAGISRNRFCQLMNVCRSGLYYEPAEESEENQEIMKIMDMYFMDHPTTGKRGFRDYLRLCGWIRFYNYKRPHQGFGGFVPSAFFFFAT